MLLDVDSLRTQYTIDDGRRTIDAVDNVSFGIERGEVFGLVGESGCGKSTIAKSILGLLPDNGTVVDGTITFDETDLTDLPHEQLRQTRWERISLISQSAMNAFDPVYTIREQIREAIDVHRDMSTEAADDRIEELFEVVGIDAERLDDYPHQFSGGMKQRAMIAMALVLEPDLVIADEPTTALDVISQDTILYYLEQLQKELDAAILLITHDMSVVAELCDRTAVMYAGKLAEVGPTESVFESPYHPYTMGLRNAFPTAHAKTAEQKIVSIPGSPPELSEVSEQCRFAPRCPFAAPECLEQTPPMEFQKPEQAAACLRINELGVESMRADARESDNWKLDVVGVGPPVSASEGGENQ